MPKPKKQAMVSVKIAPTTLTMAHNMAATVSKLGWKHFGIDRNEPATIGSVIEEGLKLFAAKNKT